MLKFIVFVFVLLSGSNGARILGIIPTPSYSHQVVFFPIWKELSLRGHQVTLCTTDPIKDPSLTNLTEIDWSFAYDLWNVKHNFTKLIKETGNNVFKFSKIMDMIHDIYDQELSHVEVQKLIKNKEAKFDLLMIEYLLPTMAAFSEQFNCPIIGLLSLDAPSSIHGLVGNPTHPILYPDFMLPFEGTLSFSERIYSSVYYFLSNFANTVYKREDLLVKKHFGTHFPPIQTIWSNVSMLFINVNMILHNVRPLVPAAIQIGGGTQIQSPKPLPQDIKSFLDNAKQGVIYFSLGTNVKSKEIPIETRQIIMDTLANLPYKVLWKFENDDLPGKPNNIKIVKWLPQQDVLRHPNIKVFITQGGLQSMEEAIFNHIPLVGMPFFGDQPTNVKKMVSRGIGLAVDKDNLDKETFGNTILEVINNPKYKKRVKELADLALDQPMTGLEKAIWWTEYVLRHKGAPHLKSNAVNLPYYQYFLLDVIGVLLLILTLAVGLLYTAIKLIIKIFKNLALEKKLKLN